MNIALHLENDFGRLLHDFPASVDPLALLNRSERLTARRCHVYMRAVAHRVPRMM